MCFFLREALLDLLSALDCQNFPRFQERSLFRAFDSPSSAAVPLFSAAGGFPPAFRIVARFTKKKSLFVRGSTGKLQRRLARKRDPPCTYTFPSPNDARRGQNGATLRTSPPLFPVQTSRSLTLSWRATKDSFGVAAPLRSTRRLRSLRPPLDGDIIHGVLGFRCSHGSSSSQARGGGQWRQRGSSSYPPQASLLLSRFCRSSLSLPGLASRLPALLLLLLLPQQWLACAADPCPGRLRFLPRFSGSPVAVGSFRRKLRFWSRAPRERRQAAAAAAGRWLTPGGTGCGGAGEDGLRPYLMLSGGTVRTRKYLRCWHRGADTSNVFRSECFFLGW